MNIVPSEEQRLLKDGAREFFLAEAPPSRLRKLRDEKSMDAHVPGLWQQMVDLGWTGIPFPEAVGGLDFGFKGLGAVFEESGRTLAATPMLSSVVLAGSAILLGGSEAQRGQWLPAIISGACRFALALEEGAHHQPREVALRATANEQGFHLAGEKSFVLDGHGADQLVVVARTQGQPGDSKGLTVFLVAADAPGVSCERSWTIDSRNVARVRLQDVQVPLDAVLGEVHQGWELLEPVLDRACACLSAEMLGNALELFERTNTYLKERVQFGVAIGSFQALQHRMARLLVQLELTRSAVAAALAALDESPGKAPLLASLAKARASDTLRLVANESVQLHGGIGVTDDLEIGLFVKRARVAEHLFGNGLFHRDRYARLRKF